MNFADFGDVLLRHVAKSFGIPLAILDDSIRLRRPRPAMGRMVTAVLNSAADVELAPVRAWPLQRTFDPELMTSMPAEHCTYEDLLGAWVRVRYTMMLSNRLSLQAGAVLQVVAVSAQRRLTLRLQSGKPGLQVADIPVRYCDLVIESK